MGSIQQVTMGAVCLAAAFAFGSYLNHPGGLSQQEDVAQFSGSSNSAAQPIKSLIAIEPQVEKRPAKTLWMQPNLQARLPMPNLPVAGVPAVDRFETSRTNRLGSVEQSGNQIPPPSDLSGRLAAAESPVQSFSQNVVEDVPDFSRPSNFAPTMPRVTDPRGSSVANLANSFSKGLADTNVPVVEDAPVFGGLTGVEPQPVPVAAIEPIQFQPLKAQPLIVEDRRSPEGRELDLNHRRESGDVYDTANLDLQSGEHLTRFRSAKPVVSLAAERSQPVSRLTSVLKNERPRDAAEESNYDANPRRVARLPFRLNREAHTNLVRLRDQAVQKISLKTTQFSDYVVESGDTLQSISTRHFGKADYYLDIYMANRNQLNSPGDLKDGMILRIPVYQ